MTRPASSGKRDCLSLTVEQRALKLAFYAVIKDVGGLTEAESYSGVSDTQLQRQCSVHHPDHFPRADVVAKLEQVGGEPHVTRLTARHAGYALVERPTVTAPDCASLHAALTASMKRSADLHAAMVDALADGVTSRDEGRVIERLAMEAAEENLRTHALARRIAEEC